MICRAREYSRWAVLSAGGFPDACQGKLKAHGQGLEQGVHHPFGHLPDVQAFHEMDGLLHFGLGDVIGPEAHGEKEAQLLFEGQLAVAGAGHIAPA